MTYRISSRGRTRSDRQALRRSIAIVGFWFDHCLERHDLLAGAAGRPVRARRARELRVVVGGTYPLADARQAQEDLVGRRTRGKLLLDPWA